MHARQWMLVVVAVLLLVVVVAVAFLAFGGGIIGPRQPAQPATVQTTNLALDVRFDYDPAILAPADFDGRAEYPLRLDGDGWSFYGKRIAGMGRMLAKAPGSLLYDFVGSQHMDSLEQWYELEPLAEPVYEDTYINGQLALHQLLSYQRTAASRGWPSYFPQSITEMGAESAASIKDVRSGSHIENRLTTDTGMATAFIEGWALFTSDDLFFFQAISPTELTSVQRTACLAIIESLQFNALLGTPAVEAPAPAEAPAESTGEQGQ